MTGEYYTWPIVVEQCRKVVAERLNYCTRTKIAAANACNNYNLAVLA